MKRYGSSIRKGQRRPRRIAIELLRAARLGANDRYAASAAGFWLELICARQEVTK